MNKIDIIVLSHEIDRQIGGFSVMVEHRLTPVAKQLNNILLTEAKLTTAQIDDIFQKVSTTGAIDKAKSGAQKTAEYVQQVRQQLSSIKQAVDTDKITDKLTRVVRNGGERAKQAMRMLDDKIDDAIVSAESKLRQAKVDGTSKIVDAVREMGNVARRHPNITGFALATITAVATMATKGLSGPVIGLLIRSALELIKGERLSTAIAKGLRTAIAGGMIGATGEISSDSFKEEINDINRIRQLAGLENLSEGPAEWASTLKKRTGSLSAKAGLSSVSSDALRQAWLEAGKPRDSADIAKLLSDNGVRAGTIKKVFTELNIKDDSEPPKKRRSKREEQPAIDTEKLDSLIVGINKLKLNKQVLDYLGELDLASQVNEEIEFPNTKLSDKVVLAIFNALEKQMIELRQANERDSEDEAGQTTQRQQNADKQQESISTDMAQRVFEEVVVAAMLGRARKFQ